MPLFCANYTHDSFMLFVAFTSALYLSSSSTISLLPNLQANIRGVLPKLSLYSISAPSSIRLLTHANLFFSIANESGVLLLLSHGSTPAPRLIKANKTFNAPISAAQCNGVCEVYPNYMFTSIPWSKNKLDLSSSSFYID